MSAKPYTRESIARVLTHHEHSRAILTVSPPYVGRPKWRLTMANTGDVLTLSDREAWVLCLGLAAGEKAGRLEEARRAG